MMAADVIEKKIRKEQLSIDQWFDKWTGVLGKSQNFNDLPIWLQYFPKILFNVINRTGNGIITKQELISFFSSLLSLPSTQINSFVDEAYKTMTSVWK